METFDKVQIDAILKSENFSFKKSLGQNFLVDPSVCPRMAASCADQSTGVLEIGPGAGVLTAELSKVAKRVVAVEIDQRLEPILKKTVGNLENVTVIFGDVLKVDIEQIIETHFADCQNVTVCANLPYYITSPIVMGLLCKKLPFKSITVMVQKEAAERLCAEVGTRAAGAVTAAVRYYSIPQILFLVGRNSFNPPPKVDSAVIRLDILKEPPVKVRDEKFFFSFVKACFAQRRKTLLNTVCNTLGIEKDLLKSALKKLSIDENIRGESLTLEQLAALCNLLNQ